MVLKVKLKILLNVIELYNWVVDNSRLADEPFAKALRSFKTYLLVNNNLYGKLSFY